VVQGGQGLGVQPVKGANSTRAVKTALTLPSHKDPTITLSVASQLAQARRKSECANPDNLLGWEGKTAHSQLIKGTKNIYKKAAYGNQPKNPVEEVL